MLSAGHTLRVVLPLLAFHIIILVIALVTFVAVCREAVSSRRSHVSEAVISLVL